MLGKLTRQDESDGCLDFAGRDGRLLVVCGKLGGLGGDALEDIWKQILESTRLRKIEKHTVDEGVQDGHGAVGDTSVWVNLLEN